MRNRVLLFIYLLFSSFRCKFWKNTEKYKVWCMFYSFQCLPVWLKPWEWPLVANLGNIHALKKYGYFTLKILAAFGKFTGLKYHLSCVISRNFLSLRLISIVVEVKISWNHNLQKTTASIPDRVLPWIDIFCFFPFENRRAFNEANEIPGCVVHLGDRPIQITLKRALATLTTWQKIKLAVNVLTSSDKITPEEVEKMKQKDLLESLLEEMAGK